MGGQGSEAGPTQRDRATELMSQPSLLPLMKGQRSLRGIKREAPDKGTAEGSKGLLMEQRYYDLFSEMRN